ncbi:hypothetical protein D1632_06860 [Chryseobacterium nematophagum]|uniref:Thiol-activated cytolysin n=1 Tax=Chryseobacterium nematophagum TaxID=2305228 RepID=A0A3M7LD21_9FLAO|nr:thiol-activated cytolysin family protein [Chryseobacterium nematophagum]RMZ59356.1 hypothetical protein D1632_06860 [Chryseobacterium nematophagum]
MKIKFSFSVMLLALLFSCNDETLSQPKVTGSASLTSKEAIYDGPASPLNLVIQNGDNISGGVSGKTDKVCQNKTYNYNKTFDEFTGFTSRTNIIWPGSFIQSETFLTENLAVYPTGENNRNKIDVKIDAIAMGKSGGAKTIDNPTAGNVQQALGELLETYVVSGTTFPANYEVSIQRAYDKTQLQMALNMGYTGLVGNVDSKFNFSFDNTKTYYAVTLKQAFFTFSVDTASKLSFIGSQSWVKNSPFNANGSPVVIETVTYGRLYSLIYESDSSATELSAALEALYRTPAGFVSGDFSTKYNNVMENTKVYAKQIGGSATDGMDAFLGTMAKNFDQVKDFMKGGAEVSKTNMGAIIHYTAINTHPGFFNVPVTKSVSGNGSYQDCTEKQYTLVLKNINYSTLPVIIRGKVNGEEKEIGKFNLAPGRQSPVFLYNKAAESFTYNDVVLTQLDLNDGKAADDIQFDLPWPVEAKSIQYRSAKLGFGDGAQGPLYKNYNDPSKIWIDARIDSDGINGGPKAKLNGNRDAQNNLVIEISKY